MILGIKKTSESSYILLPDPSEITVTDELIWAPNTGRTSSGTMVGDVKGFKITVKAKWNALTRSQMSNIVSQVRKVGADGFFNLAYFDLGGMKTMTCYASGIPRKVYSAVESLEYYQDVEISFIEK